MTTNSHISPLQPLEVVRTQASTVEFHQLELTGPAAIWLPQPSPEPVLVLGSSQDPGHYTTSSTVTRRRSGGGAVLVAEEHLSWFDVWLPSSDPRHVNDVSRSFDWLGQSLCESLADFGYDARSHQGTMVHGPWSPIICFAGLGPGEITINGRKVVGISQRRNRAGARFQVALLRQWKPADYLDRLNASHEALPTYDREIALTQLGNVALGIEQHHDDLVAHMLTRLQGASQQAHSADVAVQGKDRPERP